jgi:hypothetical protein
MATSHLPGHYTGKMAPKESGLAAYFEHARVPDSSKAAGLWLARCKVGAVAVKQFHQ